jgi:uncharacterized protein YcgI (DUF1989 family)
MNAKAESKFFIPRGEARAFVVEKGQVMRVRQPEGGGQVADLVALNKAKPAERLWGSRTAWLNGVHLSTGARLISTGPGETQLMTVVADSLTREPTPKGSYFHDVLMGCCSTRLRVQKYGPAWEGKPGCFEALAGAIAPYGCPPDYIQDTFNIFMRTGFSPEEPEAEAKYLEKPKSGWTGMHAFLEVCDAKAGEYMDLRADIDVIVAIAACQGRSSTPEAKGLEIEIRK